MENNKKPKQPNKPPKQEKKEELTERDWLELMGTNMPTYRRVNGRIKRRG